MAERMERPGLFTRWNRARRADGLALRRALPDRLLPLLVAAMAVLAALALAGATGAQILSARWSNGAASMLTVQIPDPDAPATPPQPPPTAGAPRLTRSDAVLAALAASPGASRVHRLDKAELGALLAPWLGQTNDFALILPAIIELHMEAGTGADADTLARQLATIAPGTLVERNAEWGERLGRLADSLHGCALLAVAIVIGIAVVLITATTRAGLAARRQPIELIHAMGATDGYIAGRFARRTALLAFIGGLIGSVLALPLLLLLSRVAAPFAAATPPIPSPASAADWALLARALFDTLPTPLIATLLALAPAASLIGWMTTQATVRAWLRTLP